MILVNVSAWMEYFSVGTLLKTLFKPWRQIITTTRSDQAMQIKMSALVDNLVSRVVGFSIRSIVLFVSIIFMIGVFLFDLVVAIIWPAIPVSPIFVVLFGAGVLTL